MAGVPQFASLYVGDLHPDVTEAMLYEIFNSVGPVASIRVCRDSVSRKSLGYGYVNFHSVSDAERALDTLNYSSIKGRACRIMWSQRDPSLRKSGLGNVFVRNLDRNIDNKALYDTFSLFGNILSCKVATDPTGNSYGYGFVHYETEEASKQAIEKVDGMMIGERTVQVCLFQKRDEKDGVDKENFTNIYVKNFPSEWDDDKLMSIFSEFGPVASHALRKDAKGRAFAFVAFEDVESAKKAVAEMHLKDVRSEEAKASDTGEERLGPDGHPENKMYCQRAQSKAERQAELRSKFASMDASKGGVNLYVKNLDDSIDEAGLKELFEPFGTITSAAVPLDSNGKCKGFGFVCFSSPDEATKAVTEMHLKVVKGKPLYVGLAEKREVRAERLRQRYSPSGVGGKGMGGKGEGKGGKGGNNPNMGGMMGMMPQQAMMNMMRPPFMGMMPQMMGGPKGGAPMPKAPMMGMMGGKGGPMMPGKGMPTMPMPMGMSPMMMRPMGGMMPPRPGGGQLNPAALANAQPSVQKQMIGEKLFPMISKMQPELAGKITGMMLEMDNSELLMLLDSESQLKGKVDEAMRVLQTGRDRSEPN
mmetsp:Transcript_75882/g.181533  ORF Transcript_75882/g.181533 Transcript_75882/m.181533 type:complete len:588 (+) Transcript_75882:185-1948(+)